MGFDANKENEDNDVTVSLTKDSTVYTSPYRNQSKVVLYFVKFSRLNFFIFKL